MPSPMSNTQHQNSAIAKGGGGGLGGVGASLSSTTFAVLSAQSRSASSLASVSCPFKHYCGRCQTECVAYDFVRCLSMTASYYQYFLPARRCVRAYMRTPHDPGYNQELSSQLKCIRDVNRATIDAYQSNPALRDVREVTSESLAFLDSADGSLQTQLRQYYDRKKAIPIIKDQLGDEHLNGRATDNDDDNNNSGLSHVVRMKKIITNTFPFWHCDKYKISEFLMGFTSDC